METADIKSRLVYLMLKHGSDAAAAGASKLNLTLTPPVTNKIVSQSLTQVKNSC